MIVDKAPKCGSAFGIFSRASWEGSGPGGIRSAWDQGAKREQNVSKKVMTSSVCFYLVLQRTRYLFLVPNETDIHVFGQWPSISHRNRTGGGFRRRMQHTILLITARSGVTYYVHNEYQQHGVTAAALHSLFYLFICLFIFSIPFIVFALLFLSPSKS